MELYDKSRFASGLNLTKLKREHLHLTSYSRMRVNLAAQVGNIERTFMLPSDFQVLSSSVANALEFFDLEETQETEKFVRNFDRFFDCLNVRCTSESVHTEARPKPLQKSR